jgi:CubicO group peptidase (beta-lactamase class C family)
VTLRQLLNHTSGIAQYDRVATLEQALVEGIPNYQRPMTAAQMLTACCTGKLVAKPGSRFDYNNADYLLLGRIIERLDGRPFEQSLRHRILVPLDLQNSGIAYQGALIRRLAPSYFLRPDTKTLMNDLPAYHENSDAAGAMYSTPADVARFAEALFAGRLVKSASLAAMLAPGLDDYGFGLWSYDFKRNGKTYRVAKRPGSIMGANSVLYRLIDQKTTIVILANSNHADLDEFAQRIAEKVVDQLPASTSS